MLKATSSYYRIVLFSLMSALVSLAPLQARSFAREKIPPAPQVHAAIPESSYGLQSQLKSILRTAKDKKSNQLDDLANGLQIPESANWFSAAFGEELGSGLAAAYKNSWKDYEYALVQMFRENASGKHFQVFVKEYSPSSPVPSDSFIQAILQNSKIPLKLYTAGSERTIQLAFFPAFTSIARDLSEW
jgi:hypothetical protein